MYQVDIQIYYNFFNNHAENAKVKINNDLNKINIWPKNY